MAETKIEWTHGPNGEKGFTFNPWMGCQKVSPACDHCYAEVNKAVRTLGVQWGTGAERRRTSEANWKLPTRWNAEAERLGIRYRVFCASLADVFDNAVPPEWRRDLFDLIAKTPHLDWLLLTKRIGNVNQMAKDALVASLHDTVDGPPRMPPNVWIGATICNQPEADRDIPKLLAVPAAKRFLSMEPLLGPVDLRKITVRSGATPTALSISLGDYVQPLTGNFTDSPRIDWVIVGGESGHHARPMHPDWARSLRDQCQAAGVPFLFKQWGEWAPTDLYSASDRRRDILPDGSEYTPERIAEFETVVTVRRVGKQAAGRMLDGRLWDAVPA